MENLLSSNYKELLPQIVSLIEGETDETAVMANVAAALHDAFPDRFFWVGFYRVRGQELLLGPFQGPVACIHIGYGKGVCGTAWKEGKTLVVDDVEKFPGHIACSSLSRSEIVVPLKDSEGRVFAVLDIDSRNLSAFTSSDKEGLEAVARIVSATLEKA
jgi:GAF domain-containing protein